MKIQIESHDIKITKALRAHVDLRLGFSLSRFAEHIDCVTVNFSNAEEHHSAPDKRCRIQVSLLRPVSVQGNDADLFTAVDRAANRAARSVARAIKRENERLERISPKHLAKKPAPAPPSPKVKRKPGSGPASKLKQKRSSALRRK